MVDTPARSSFHNGKAAREAAAEVSEAQRVERRALGHAEGRFERRTEEPGSLLLQMDFELLALVVDLACVARTPSRKRRRGDVVS